MKRREFFNSIKSKIKKEEEKQIIRPPYYKDKDLFLKECINCEGFCVLACEENIISINEDKTPIIDFSNGGYRRALNKHTFVAVERVLNPCSSTYFH